MNVFRLVVWLATSCLLTLIFSAGQCFHSHGEAAEQHKPIRGPFCLSIFHARLRNRRKGVQRRRASTPTVYTLRFFFLENVIPIGHRLVSKCTPNERTGWFSRSEIENPALGFPPKNADAPWLTLQLNAYQPHPPILFSCKCIITSY